MGVVVAIFLTSCFEIREEFDIKSNGSGTYKFVMDMAQMGEMMKSMQESMPDSAKQESDGSMGNIVAQGSAKDLEGIEGITNIISINDKETFIFGAQFDFANIDALNKALCIMSRDSVTGDMPPALYSFNKKTGFSRKWHDQYFVSKVFSDRGANLGGGGGGPEVEQILGKVLYKCVVRTSGATKKYSKSKVKVNSPTELIYEIPLAEMEKSRDAWQFFVKFK